MFHPSPSQVLQFSVHKPRGPLFLAGDHTLSLLEELEHAQTQLATMLMSRHILPLKEEASQWAVKLTSILEVLQQVRKGGRWEGGREAGGGRWEGGGRREVGGGGRGGGEEGGWGGREGEREGERKEGDDGREKRSVSSGCIKQDSVMHISGLLRFTRCYTNTHIHTHTYPHMYMHHTHTHPHKVAISSGAVAQPGGSFQ